MAEMGKRERMGKGKMRNDLIRRSELIQSLRGNVLVDVTPNLEQAINEQPTAYDVDKILEQMETEAKRWQESGEEYEDKRELGIAEGFKKAIGIVKSGGIDEF